MTKQIAFVVLVMLLLAVLAWTTEQSSRLLRRITPAYNVLLSLPDNAARLFLILVCVVAGLWLGPGVDALGWQTDRLWQDVALGGAAGLLAAPLTVLGGNLAAKRWGPGVYDNRLLRAIVPVNEREWWGVVLALLPAALLEEMLFRSMPLAGLSYWISPWVVMWPLALFFGLLHRSQGEWGVVGTALLGVLLSALFLLTGSIWATLAAHWVLNVLEVSLARRQGLRPLRAG